MRTLTKGEIGLMQKAIGDDRTFALLQEIASECLISMTPATIVGDTEFETVKNAVGRDERKRAITMFLKELERITHGN